MQGDIHDTGRARLRRARLARGLSLRECAQAAGIDPSYLSRIERNKCGLSVPILLRLSRVLRLDDLTRHLAAVEMEDAGVPH
jgi:transcriptional regulator with XRE-family HTH domain